MEGVNSNFDGVSLNIEGGKLKFRRGKLKIPESIGKLILFLPAAGEKKWILRGKLKKIRGNLGAPKNVIR